MTRRADVLTAVLALLAVLVATAAAPAQRNAQPARDLTEFEIGTHALRFILNNLANRKLVPLGEDNARPDPKNTLVVVFGNPAPLDKLHDRLGGLRKWVEDGGALWVATDFTTPPILKREFGVGVNGNKLLLPDGGTQDVYAGVPEFPFVHWDRAAGPPFVEQGPPVFRGEPALPVATDVPSYLELSDEAWPDVRAFLSADCTFAGPVRNRGDALRFHGQSWPLAYSRELGKGRVLVIADHSIFINMMFQLQQQTRTLGNLDFAYRCAEWLQTPPGEIIPTRKQILFYEDGAVQTNFHIPFRQVPGMPLPPPETLMGMIDQALHGLEEEGTFAKMEEDDIFNETVESVMAAIPLWKWAAPEEKIWTLAVIGCSIVLGIYGFLRLGGFRHRHDATGPLLADLLSKQGSAGTILAARHEALVREGNLWEAARDLVRQMFASAGTAPDSGSTPPTIEVRGSWWRRWRTRARWRTMWRLARSARPVRVSPRRFASLVKQVRELRTALADGAVRIVP